MKTYKKHHFRQILAATLALSSSFGMISPVLAQAVAAGTDIKNTATATFSDGTTTYNATSNEVVIKVAEVAGVTITPQSPSNANPNAGDDTVYVDYVITNTGNDRTQFFIPGTATLSNTTAFQLSPTRKIQIIAVDGTAITPKDVPTAGAATGDTALLGATQGSIAPNPGTGNTGTITVRIPIRVLPGASAGATLTVSLGETTPANEQNKDRAGNTGTKDVYTVDNADGATGETPGTPTIVREAMATSSAIIVGARQQAFSTVLKAVSSYSTGALPNNVSDDILTYTLALKVEDPTTPPPGLVTSDLYGTAIKGLDPAKAYVLVSDAIPTGMKLGTVNTSLPTGWQAIYTTDPLATTALNATWSATPSGKITRVGFVYDTSTVAGPLKKGTTATGLTFTVTPDTGFTGGQIANIAQTFGQSQPGSVEPGTSTQIVYDESGDQTPNNGLNGNNPDPATAGATVANGGISSGVADPAADGTDPGTGTDPTAANTNQGPDTGAGAGTKPTGGEVNVYNIAATPLNGPNGQPAAIGPNNNNDDFTNKSIVVSAGKNPADTLTDEETTPVTFNNTMQNTSGSSQIISLLPTPPATPGDLPDNTKVTITDPATGGQTASYTYTVAGGFVPSTGTTPPVRVTVPAGGNANYTVTVDLPGNVPQLKGYPVPITSFVDVNGDGLAANEPSNITIDRVYTNYLELKKEARILEANGTTEVVGFTTTQASLAAAATPGRIIEYQITYTNISIGNGSGSNNAILPANNLVITEDGNAGNNTWFGLTLDPKYPAQPEGSATGAGTIDVTVTNGDIEIYTNTVTSVAPGSNLGKFTFQRKIK